MRGEETFKTEASSWVWKKETNYELSCSFNFVLETMKF